MSSQQQPMNPIVPRPRRPTQRTPMHRMTTRLPVRRLKTSCRIRDQGAFCHRADLHKTVRLLRSRPLIANRKSCRIPQGGAPAAKKQKVRAKRGKKKEKLYLQTTLVVVKAAKATGGEERQHLGEASPEKGQHGKDCKDGLLSNAASSGHGMEGVDPSDDMESCKTNL